MLYVVWGGEAYRPTRDLDLLGYGAPRPEEMVACLRSLCSLEVANDGLLFLPDSVKAEEIRDKAEYDGIRIRLQVYLGNIPIHLQVDIGFGDAVVPHPQEQEFPTLLGGPAPRIRAYPRESVVAEKLHAAALLGDVNSRMKDFYDLFVLPKLFPFEGSMLTWAIAATFECRHLPLPTAFPLRADFFADDARARQWRTYLVRNALSIAPHDFTSVGEAIREFLTLPYDALGGGIEFLASWPPGGPWR
jgi:hypothetical protein